MQEFNRGISRGLLDGRVSQLTSYATHQMCQKRRLFIAMIAEASKCTDSGNSLNALKQEGCNVNGSSAAGLTNLGF